MFSSLNRVEPYLVRSLLTCEGIASRLRNEFVVALAGEVPMNDVRIEVLVSAADAAQAAELIAQSRRTDGVPATCPACGEESPAGFEICWSCERELPPPGLRLV